MSKQVSVDLMRLSRHRRPITAEMTLSHAHPCLEHHVIGFSSLADEQHSRWMILHGLRAGAGWSWFMKRSIRRPPQSVHYGMV